MINLHIIYFAPPWPHSHSMVNRLTLIVLGEGEAEAESH